MTRQVPFTRRRILWAVGLGIGGFLIGGKGGGVWGTLLGLIWGASIGYGFGCIFDQKHPRKKIVVYWATTLALVTVFIGLLVAAGIYPEPSLGQQIVAGAAGAIVGVLLGLLVGSAQLWSLRRKRTN